jgi:NAD(P)-dependent dehydrogenase (short-subunit alcohol dehydrogenase family)
MKSVVITGSTRGIGFAMANSFLETGCMVTVAGRSKESAENAVSKLSSFHGAERVAGFPCEVSDLEQVEALWKAAVQRFGRVDIWVNNAGIAHNHHMLWELPAETMQALLNTNLLGTMYGVRIAMEGMLKQGGGQIYNLEGLGSTGRIQNGLSGYGMTKAAITYYSKALVQEAKDTPVLIGTLRPGMVITDMVLDPFKDRPEELERVRGIFNTIADRPENVAPFLVKEILKNNESGRIIQYMSRLKMMLRFLTAPFSKRDVFSR